VTRAIEVNLWEYWKLFGRLSDANLHDTPELLRVSTALPFPFLNGVVRTNLTPDRVDATVVATLDHFQQRNVPALWLIGPSSQPADLDRMLVAHGLSHISDDPGMAMDLHRLNDNIPSPIGLVIERVDDATALRIWCGFTDQADLTNALFELSMAIGFGIERPLSHYLGWLNGQPVATASLVLGGGVAGICNVMTIPGAQRQGIGSLMTAVPLREARSKGYRIGVLQSTKMGVNLYHRLGFQEYCTISIYQWQQQQNSEQRKFRKRKEEEKICN
jgi:ribosomal protein S18 acetylase RimI-like enzyme